MYDWSVITCIKTVNKNSTRSKLQLDQTNGILHGVINGTGSKQAQNKFNS